MEKKTPGPHKHRLVCLHWATQQAWKRTQLRYILSLCVLRGDIFTSPFSLRPPTSFFVTTMTPGRTGGVVGRWGHPFMNPTGVCVTQTNQYAVIVPVHVRVCCWDGQPVEGGEGRGGEGKGSGLFPLHWLSCVLGDDASLSEMAQWFLVYQNAYGHYNSHCFPTGLTWVIALKCSAIWSLQKSCSACALHF